MDALYFLAWFLFIFVFLPMMGAMFGLILYMAYTVLKKFIDWFEELENNRAVSTNKKSLMMYLTSIILGLICFYFLERLAEIYNYQGY